MKEVRGEGLKLGRSKRGFYSCFYFSKPHQQHPQLLDMLVALKFPHRGFTTPALIRDTSGHWGDVERDLQTIPSPTLFILTKGRHIPFCLLIKSWLINQTSGSYTSLSFEGKALFSKAPSCKPVVPSPAPTAQLITPLLFAMNSPCLCQASSWTLITTTNA